MDLVDFLFRWAHVLAGVTWIGLLYYFNFIQGEYFKEAEADAKADATTKLAPRALWWFRWGAMWTFLTGLYLLYLLGGGVNQYIALGALMGIFMFLNVWLIIWPAQQIALGMKDGDAPAAGAKALLASRTNTLFSAPMVYFMLASAHKGSQYSTEGLSTGLWIAIAIIILLEINALIGKQGPMTKVVGVIHGSIALTVVLALVLHYI